MHLQFCNMIVNDSTYLLGEALEKLPQVRVPTICCIECKHLFTSCLYPPCLQLYTVACCVSSCKHAETTVSFQFQYIFCKVLLQYVLGRAVHAWLRFSMWPHGVLPQNVELLPIPLMPYRFVHTQSVCTSHILVQVLFMHSHVGSVSCKYCAMPQLGCVLDQKQIFVSNVRRSSATFCRCSCKTFLAVFEERLLACMRMKRLTLPPSYRSLLLQNSHVTRWLGFNKVAISNWYWLQYFQERQESHQ